MTSIPCSRQAFTATPSLWIVRINWGNIENIVKKQFDIDLLNLLIAQLPKFQDVSSFSSGNTIIIGGTNCPVAFIVITTVISFWTALTMASTSFFPVLSYYFCRLVLCLNFHFIHILWDTFRQLSNSPFQCHHHRNWKCLCNRFQFPSFLHLLNCFCNISSDQDLPNTRRYVGPRHLLKHHEKSIKYNWILLLE